MNNDFDNWREKIMKNQKNIVELSAMDDNILDNNLSQMSEDELIELSASAKNLNKMELANKIDRFIYKNYVVKWNENQAEKYVSICEHLHKIVDIEALRDELSNFSNEDIHFIKIAAEKKYPDDIGFSDQIGVQHNRYLTNKLAEFIKDFYSGKIDEFMENNSDIVISNVKEFIDIYDLKKVIPEATQALFEYGNKTSFTK